MGIGKVLIGAAAGLVLSTLGVASALGTKTDENDFKAHVQDEQRRMYSLESKQDILDTLQRISLTQQEKVEIKLDKVLADHGHSFTPSIPIVLPTQPPASASPLTIPSPHP